jgi:hypothetical protein
MRPATNQTKLKFYEVVNWLIGPNQDVPERFVLNKTQLNSIVPYLVEQFWTKPKLVKFLNKSTNDLFRIPDPIEQLKLTKKLVALNSISKYDLYSKFPDRRPDVIKEIQERENYDEGNASSKALMLKHKIGCLEMPSEYSRQKATKAALRQASTDEDKKMVKTLLEQKEETEATMARSSANATIYLDTLTQEIIDKEELVLFDISLLKKTNRVLFIFIDKNNTKRYYTEPFQAKIYKSILDGVINNDYIEEYNENVHQPYVIKNIGLYNKLKYMMNRSYGRLLNGT